MFQLSGSYCSRGVGYGCMILVRVRCGIMGSSCPQLILLKVSEADTSNEMYFARVQVPKYRASTQNPELRPL